MRVQSQSAHSLPDDLVWPWLAEGRVQVHLEQRGPAGPQRRSAQHRERTG